MDNTVKMRRPGATDYAETTQTAFEEVWKEKGWELVPEDEVLTAPWDQTEDVNDEEIQDNNQEESNALHAKGDDEDLLRPNDR